MILIYCLLAPFIGLVIIGFHAVTRKGMLLSGLGSDNTDFEQIEGMKEELKEDLLKLQQDFFFEASDLIEGGNDITALTNFYLSAFERCVEVHSEELSNFHCQRCKEKTKFERFKAWISKPFSECTTCMSSVWTIAVMTVFFINQSLLIIFVPFAVAGIIQLFEGIKPMSKQ